MKISTYALAAGTTLGAALSTALATVPATGAAAAPSASAASYQQCWYGKTHTAAGGGAQMQYYECRRGSDPARQQSSIKIRVRDTRANDHKCGLAVGKIGYTKSPNGGHQYWPTRVSVKSCTASHWSAWKRSGWWNGNQAHEIVYTS